MEILAALQTRFPGAPDIPASELAGMRTLQDVVDTIAGFAAPTPAPATPAPAGPAQPSISAPEVVLAVVSEKTGYPTDMLNLGMEMEAELGIDSIKQVEILAALQTRFPGAPDIPASELAGMRTLQDVVDTIAGFAAPTAAPAGGATVSGAGQDAGQAFAPAGRLVCTEAVLREVPPTGFAMAGLYDGEVLITREDPAFAADLERVLIARGIKARTVDEVPDRAAAVISLAALAPMRSPQDCVEMHVRAFRAARSVARSEAESPVFVTVQSTGARFAGSDAPIGVASLVKTASWEWPNASVRAIDVETLDPERVAAELLAGGSGVEVALRADGVRLVVDDAEVAEVPAGANRSIGVEKGGVVVVTGGARGVTARSALALAARHGLRLALIGRTPLREAGADEPSGASVAEVATALVAAAQARGETLTLPQARAQAETLIAGREVRATLSTARELGIDAEYLTADVNDPAELRRILDGVRRDLGPIVGVVHGAGVLADKRLEDLDDDQFVRVFGTKVLGAEALLAATSSDDVRFISLFSSVAARAGNPGQSAYAAANAALESIAAREAARRGSDCVVHAFGWGPWDGGMVDATLKSRFLDAGVGVIPLDEGARFFAEHAVSSVTPTSIVVTAPAAPRLRATRLDWDVCTESLPALTDHQVRGRVVVPVVIVLDALLRAARGLMPHGCPVVRDLQVLSGVTFEAGEHHPLTIGFEAAGSGYVVTLRDGDGRARYRAVLETAREASAVSVPPISGSPWPLTVAEAYTGPLFHGPRFAVIDSLDAMTDAGGTATVKGLAALGWPDGAWAIDPAAVDGGLQLAIVWAAAHGRPLVLPQRVGSFVLHRPFGGDTALRCRLSAHPVNDKRVDYDIVFETMAGEPVAALGGVEFYAVGAAADSPE